jgi:hypothetical protein
MKFQLAPYADLELLMNTPLPTAPIRHVIVVTVLSLACAFCSGCDSRAEASATAPAPTSAHATATATASANAPARAGSTAADTVDWQMHAPAAAVDEKPITTMESIGAAEV